MRTAHYADKRNLAAEGNHSKNELIQQAKQFSNGIVQNSSSPPRIPTPPRLPTQHDAGVHL